MQGIPRSELRRLEAEASLGRRLAEKLVGVRAELKAAHATIATLKGEVTGLMTLGDNLQRQMAELKSRLGTDSQNSSKAPSSDGPAVSKGPGRKGTGRGRGGQPDIRAPIGRWLRPTTSTRRTGCGRTSVATARPR